MTHDESQNYRLSSLPPSWQRARIGEITHKQETANPALSGEGNFFYVDIEAVDNVAHRITSPKTLPRATPPSRARHVIRSGDVIISLVRPRLKNIAIVPEELDEQWASTAFCVCRPFEGIDPRYLHYLFINDEFVRGVKTYGDSPPSGHDEDLLSTQIPIPPAAEQVRIADRLDELFTDLSAGLAALERVKKKLKRYRSAVLHAAVTGRLTAEWRKSHGQPSESADKLLACILIERRRQWEKRTLGKYAKDERTAPKNWRDRYPQPFPLGTLAHGAALPELPKSWCWATHDQVGDVQLGRQRSPEHHNGPHMRPYLRVANVHEDRIDTSDVLQMNFTPEEFKVYALKRGDILLNEGQSMELIGRPAMYRDELPGGCFQNTLVRQRMFEGVIADYGLIVCLAQFRSGRFRKIASITTSIAHLGAQRFAALEFPLPPLEEQGAIIEAVNEKLSQIEAMEVEVDRGLARAARLRQAILKSAFAGKLVPQDAADEPAAVLLERVKRERTGVEKPIQRRGGRKQAVKAGAAEDGHAQSSPRAASAVS